MAKVDKKELAKMARKLNKMELTEDPVDVKQELEALQEDFIQAIEEIDDAGKVDEVDEDVIDYYESLIEEPAGKKGKDKEEAPDFDEMDKDELLEFVEENEDLDMPKKFENFTTKKLRKAVVEAFEEMEEKPDPDEKKGKGKGKKDSSDDVDLDELREELEDMDKDDLSDWLDENDMEIETKVTKKNLEDCVEEIMEEMEERQKKGKKKGGKKKVKSEGSSTTGKNKGGSGREQAGLPQGFRVDTEPANVYQMIADGGTTLENIAKMIGKKKKKKPEQVMNHSLFTVVRKVSRVVPINAVMSGSMETIHFELIPENDDE